MAAWILELSETEFSVIPKRGSASNQMRRTRGRSGAGADATTITTDGNGMSHDKDDDYDDEETGEQVALILVVAKSVRKTFNLV